MNLTVVGAGFVGLVTAAVFADFKNEVWVLDNDEGKIKKLSSGKIPFYEPGLKDLIIKNFKSGRLKFTTDYAQAIPNSEIIFICVGTPNKDGKIDLSYLYAATKAIAQNLKEPTIIAIKSTVPPGINQKLEKWMKKYTKGDFDLVSVPEFLSEGQAIENTLNPHRVVIGTEKRAVIKKLLKLHQSISGERLICDAVSAQMIKFAANTFLPLKISFANAIAILCDKFGAQADKVLKGLGMDKRIGDQFLGAGIGYGGSCFPKDLKTFIKLSSQVGYNFHLLKSAQKINDDQIDYFLKKLTYLIGGSLKGRRITVLGLTFKPKTSDIRESRAIAIIKELKKKGAKIHVCDPIAIPEAKKLITRVKFFENPYQALKGAEALLLVTEWEEYQKLNFQKIKKLMKKPLVIDGRNIYNREELEKLGFIYEGIGK